MWPPRRSRATAAAASRIESASSSSTRPAPAATRCRPPSWWRTKVSPAAPRTSAAWSPRSGSALGGSVTANAVTGAPVPAEAEVDLHGRAMLADGRSIGSEREGEDRRAGDDGALGRPHGGRFRGGRALHPDPLPARQVPPQLHADGRPGADGDGLGLAGSAPVRPVVGPPGRDLADSDGRRRRRDRDRARLGRAGVRPGRGVRDRLRARHGGLPPRRLEVRGLRQRPQARERDVALLGRRQSRVRAGRTRVGAAHPWARPARRAADRRAGPGRGRDPLLGPLVSARLRSGPGDDSARARGTTTTARSGCCSR